MFRAILLAALLVGAHTANAHDLDCRGNPIPSWVKLNCCGKPDAHVVSPENVQIAANGDFIVTWKQWTWVVPRLNAMPSTNGCSVIFFEDPVDYHDRQGDVQPTVYCFFTFMGM